jgi:hypothetical protein
VCGRTGRQARTASRAVVVSNRTRAREPHTAKVHDYRTNRNPLCHLANASIQDSVAGDPQCAMLLPVPFQREDGRGAGRWDGSVAVRAGTAWRLSQRSAFPEPVDLQRYHGRYHAQSSARPVIQSAELRGVGVALGAVGFKSEGRHGRQPNDSIHSKSCFRWRHLAFPPCPAEQRGLTRTPSMCWSRSRLRSCGLARKAIVTPRMLDRDDGQ